MKPPALACREAGEEAAARPLARPERTRVPARRITTERQASGCASLRGAVPVPLRRHRSGEHTLRQGQGSGSREAGCSAQGCPPSFTVIAEPCFRML